MIRVVSLGIFAMNSGSKLGEIVTNDQINFGNLTPEAIQRGYSETQSKREPV